MLKSLKGFAFGSALGMAVTAAILILLPAPAERKLRKSTRGVRRYGSEALDALADLF